MTHPKDREVISGQSTVSITAAVTGVSNYNYNEEDYSHQQNFHGKFWSQWQ